jgi:Protein of unknown function (DUF1499)
MRIPIRTSKWATAARRFASVALPFVVVPIFIHRAGAMTTLAFEIVEGFGALLAVLAILAALIAFVRIWVSGDRGWGRAVTGFVFGAICLAPAAVLATDFMHYPLTDEVTTNPLDPPPLISGVEPRSSDPKTAARLAVLFPNLQPRNYPLNPDTVFRIVVGIVRDDGWQVLRENPPDDNGQGGQVNALAATLFGFREEVSVRLDPTADGTLVAIRSASLTPLHEPGANGVRVVSFLAELDRQIAVLQQQPAGSAGDNGDETGQAPLPAPPPPRQGKR